MTASSRSLSDPGSAISAITPSLEENIVQPVDPGPRVEYPHLAQQQRGRRPLGGHERRGMSHAARLPPTGAARRRTGSAERSARLPGSAAARQQLIQDGHAHDDTRLDLGGDHRLRRVDDLAGELDAPVHRAGVHQHLLGGQPSCR